MIFVVTVEGITSIAKRTILEVIANAAICVALLALSPCRAYAIVTIPSGAPVVAHVVVQE
jgi:hypothetical protein